MCSRARIIRSRAGWKIDGLEILLIKNQKKNKHAKLPHLKRILYFCSFICKTLTNSFIYIHIHIIEKQVKKSFRVENDTWIGLKTTTKDIFEETKRSTIREKLMLRYFLCLKVWAPFPTGFFQDA